MYSIACAGIRAPKGKAQRGFTLIELLVVLVLLGLVAGVALTTVGSGNQARELANEVNRLHGVLRMGAEEAIFSNSEIGVVIESDLYEFLVFDEQKQQWQTAPQHFLRPYTLPEWISIDFQREGKERKILGKSEDGAITEKETKKPQLMLLSSGEVTGFTIGLQISTDADSRIEIKTNEQGEIVLPSADQE